MKKYIGKKSIKAKPMNRLEYNQYRGWTLPSDENPNDEGMFVEYVDGGKANHSDHEGYISWSPIDVFNKAYSIAETHSDRVKIELDELKQRMDALEKFADSEAIKEISNNARHLLCLQALLMRELAGILEKRIDLMSKESA